MDREPDSDDIVLWLLRKLVDEVRGVSSNTVIEVEREARIRWGGQRKYIAKRTPAPLPTAPAGRDRRRGRV